MKTKMIFYFVAIILIAGAIIFGVTRPKVEKYSSDVENEIDFIKRNLVSGGPPKDGIPAIDNPKYISLEEADGILENKDKVFGVDYKGFVVAYPQDILFWHEIVNEEIDGEKISVSYCPLTESIIGYKGLNLGVSGELYNSNLVMYDRESDGRIPQIRGQFIEGEKKGELIEHFPVVVTTWGKWKEKHPDTLVLSRDTDFNRNYDRNPYPGYDKIYRLWFPVVAESNLLKTKDLVLGIENNDEFVAILKEGFPEKYPDGLDITVGGKSIHVDYDTHFDTFMIDDSEVKSFEVFWFAWYAYHPETELIK